MQIEANPRYVGNNAEAYRSWGAVIREVVAAPARARSLPLSLCVVQLIAAYEWMISGLNKLINSNFTVQLGSNLHGSVFGNPYSWYVGFLRDVVLPNARLFGVLAEAGELAFGCTLAAGAVLWIWKPRSPITALTARAAVAALGGAIFLSLNYFFQGGSPLPWLNPGNAFNEGVETSRHGCKSRSHGSNSHSLRPLWSATTVAGPRIERTR